MVLSYMLCEYKYISRFLDLYGIFSIDHAKTKFGVMYALNGVSLRGNC